jgi:hypothetical protein
MSIGVVRRAPSRGTPWLITFVDLVGLLLAFFVLQFAMTNLDGNRLQAMFGTASADAPPIAGERADRDAILGARPLDEMIDSGYLAAVLRDRLAGDGNASVAVRSTESSVLVELDGVARGADAASARAAALVALRPALDLLRRLEADITLHIAVADPASEIAWQSALVEGEALAADLVAAGLVSKLGSVAVATPGAPHIALLVANPAGGGQ